MKISLRYALGAMVALFLIGYMIGVDTNPAPVVVNVTVVSKDQGCTTDTDCLEKYGCDDYANPCEAQR